MAQFTLTWDNTDVLSSGNSINQRASVRRKTPVGAWVTAGFSPTNDLATSVITVITPALIDNVIYQFKIETICTAGGPTINDNGIQEAIQFGCINPTIENTDVTAQLVLNVINTDITKARITLRLAADDSPISIQVVNKLVNSITANVNGLIPSTSYYWQVELYTIVDGVEIVSSSSDYINNPCGAYAFTTESAIPPDVCPAPDNFEVVTFI